MPKADRLTACSRSASAKTMFGDLPPSSKVTSFSVRAARPAIRLPVSVEPVNAILSTSGWSTSASPARPPKPGTTFTTPGGKSSCSIERREGERRHRRVLRRLDDDRVAARERRAELPGEHHERRVPGNDRADDADRLAPRVGQERPDLRHRVARARSGRRRRSTRSSARSSSSSAAISRSRLAVVARLDPGEHVAVGVDHARPCRHSTRARSAPRVRPQRALERLPARRPRRGRRPPARLRRPAPRPRRWPGCSCRSERRQPRRPSRRRCTAAARRSRDRPRAPPQTASEPSVASDGTAHEPALPHPARPDGRRGPRQRRGPPGSVTT